MDAPFVNQSGYMVKNHKNLEKKVYSVPEKLDTEIARLKLNAMGIKIDALTKEQKAYLNSWQSGT
jgi:adenosylhomocysteinase